jgi:hypothetical protein
LTNDEVVNKIIGTTDPNYGGQVGSGRINAYKALTEAPQFKKIVFLGSSVEEASGNGNEYTINLESAGWSANHHPQTLKSVIQPLTSRLEQPLLLTQSRGSPGRYHLSHALAGYEVALFEVPIHGR